MKTQQNQEQESRVQIMREQEVPTPKDSAELGRYIDGLVNQQHSYGTCVYAMSMAATAAFNMVASRLGVTGFQASCADLDIVRRTRRIKGPFMLIKLEDALYPQCDLLGKVRDEFLQSENSREWLRAEAQKCLDEAEKDGFPVHPNVKTHWHLLAAWPRKGG